jgi:hypothetical protein
MEFETTCKPCGYTTDQTLTAHLAERHLNEMLDIETDPATGKSVIHGPAGA